MVERVEGRFVVKTMKWGNEEHGFVFARMHDDLSGGVEFDDGHGDPPKEIPGAFLKRIVAEWVRRQQVSRIEQMGTDGLLLDGTYFRGL